MNILYHTYGLSVKHYFAFPLRGAERPKRVGARTSAFPGESKVQILPKFTLVLCGLAAFVRQVVSEERLTPERAGAAGQQ